MRTAIKATSANLVNGQLVTLKARGSGSAGQGTAELKWEFSAPIKGYPKLVTVLCTTFGTSMIFALESNGGKNFKTLANGNFKFDRILDFGAYGKYDIRAEIRMSANRVTAYGLTLGSMKLPEQIRLPESLTETMYAAGPREIRSFMPAILHDNKGRSIPVAITTVYSPITEEERDWTRRIDNQIRRSFIRVVSKSPTRLVIEHTTIIAATTAPALPK